MALNKAFRYYDYKQMQNYCLLKKKQEQKKIKNKSKYMYITKYTGLSSPRPETLLHSVPKRLTKIFR